MIKRRIINIFIVVSIVILVLVLIRTGLMERAIGLLKDRLPSDGIIVEEQDDHPEYIYETFIDGEGNEVSVKMERKTGTINGEEVVFYEDTVGSEVIYYRFYKGVISNVDDKKIVFIVDKECLDGDPEDSFYDYEDVEDYELVFYLDEYSINTNEVDLKEIISINSNEIDSYKEIELLTGKYVRVQDSKFKDWLSKQTYKGLDFYQY
jgi:hypothetical protein